MPRLAMPRLATSPHAAPLDIVEAAALFAPLMGRDAGASSILLAVSGGPDSVALLHLVGEWRKNAPAQCPPLFAATVDHGLRPESAGEAALVARWCAARDIPHATLPWTGDKPASGVQEAARDARYRLLAGHAEAIGATHLATAHHADDQAETVLMRLARGSGLKGLAGMAPSRSLGGVHLVRPFLPIPKARLVATLIKAGQPFVEDPSNRDDRFTRARFRGLATILAREGLSPDRIATLAQRAARADAALDAAAAAAFSHLCEREGGLMALRPEALAQADEILIRLLLLALGDDPPIRLERAERLAQALLAARRAGEALRRTIAGRIVSLDRLGRVTFTAEKERRRGSGASSKGDESS